jgi:hypothetical protein
MRESVGKIFGELVKAPFKKETEAKSFDIPKPRAISKGKNTRGTQGKDTQPQATCTPHKTTYKTHKQFHPYRARRGNGHQTMRMRSLPATNRLL